MSLIVVVGCATVLALGKYRALEALGKALVVLFSVLVLVTAGVAATGFGGLPGPVAAPFTADRESFFFLVAMVGWMPVGLAAAPMLSAWICARAERRKEPIAAKDAYFDFGLGYIGSVMLALCFVVIGAAVLFSAGVAVVPHSAGFAQQLTDLFAETFSPVMGPVVSLLALIVMLTTVFGTMDGFTRLLAGLTQRILRPADEAAAARYYLWFLLIEVLVAGALLFFLMRSFLTFLDIATTTSFLSAPVIAAANHRIIFADGAAQRRNLPDWFRRWSLTSIALLAAAAVLFLVLRVGL